MAYCAPNLVNHSEPSALPAIPVSSFFTTYQQARYNTVLDFVKGEIFRAYVKEKGWTVADLSHPKKQALIYKGAKGYLENALISWANGEDSIWKNLSEQAATEIDTLIKNYDAFVNEHITYNGVALPEDSTIEEEATQEANGDTESGVDKEEEEGNKGKDFDRIGNEQSQFELASADIKMLFRLLPKAFYNATTKQVELVMDKDGLPSTAEVNTVWNLLLERTQGEKDLERFRSILLSDRVKQIIPEVQFINEALRTENPRSHSEVKQFVSFYQRFSKPKVILKSQFRDNTGKVVLNEEIKGNRLKIESIFNKNFIEGTIPEQYKKYVHKSNTGVFYLQNTEGKTLPELPDDTSGRMNFLGLLGVQFSGLDLLDSDEKERFDQMVNETALRLYDGLKQRLDLGLQVKKPLTDLKTKYEHLRSERDSIERIIDFESKYSKIAPTHSVRNSNGELEYLISQDSALSLTTYHLNKAATLEELYTIPSFRNARYNTQFHNSYIINFLFDKQGNKREGRSINLERIIGIKEKDTNGKTKGKVERELSAKMKLIQDYNNFLLEGRTDTMRTETSNSFYMLGLYNKGQSHNYIDLKGFRNSFFDSRSFKQQILHYLNGEIARINSFSEKQRQNSEVPEGYKSFSIFSEVFDNQNEDLQAKLLEQGNLTAEDPLFQSFIDAYEKVLNKELSLFKEDLDRKGITYNELLSVRLKEEVGYENGSFKTSPDSLHRAFIAGTLLQNIEFSILYTGDTIFYKDLHKRLKGLSSTGNIAADLSVIEQYFQSQPEQLFYQNYSLAGARKVGRRDNTQNFKSQTLKEYPVQDKKTFGYLQSNLAKEMEQSILLRDGKTNKYTASYFKDLVNSVLYNKEGKLDVKPADGQGYINLDFHRELAYRFGFHSEAMETAYRYEGLIFRRDIIGESLTQSQARELEGLEQEIMKHPNLYGIPVLKMSYWGAIENTTLDLKAYDKFSTFPILPSVARNHPELKKILLDMVDGQYGYVKYESGTKLYKTTPVTRLKGAEPDLLTTPLLKEQISTHSTQKTQTTIPTQLLKLVYSNLFSNGAPTTEKAGNLYREYKEILRGIQVIQRKKLSEDIGITLGDNGLTIDRKVLQQKLIKEARSKQYNSNIVNALMHLETLSPEASGFHRDINNLLAGIIDKTLRRFKVTGGDFILVSNANMSPLPWYRFTKDGTLAIGCRITLTKEYAKLLNQIHPDGGRIGTLQRLNDLLKDKKWVTQHEKELTIILDRVPTQSPNSMDFAIVQELLPPTCGNVIILPDEIVLKSGTDFDYDKEKVLTPSFTSNGAYIENTHAIEEQIEELKKQRKGLITDYYNSKNPSQSIMQIRDYVQDITNALEKGRFDYLKPSVQGESDLQNIQKAFTQVTNLEIAKDYLQGQLDQMDSYEDFDEEMGEFINIPSANLQFQQQQEMEQLRDEINFLTASFSAQLKQFKNKEVFNAINEGYHFKDRIISLLQMQDRQLEDSANQIIQNYRNVLSLPEMFAELVSPNSNRLTKKIATQTAENTNRSLQLPSKGRALYYSENLKVFGIFFDAKDMLAPFAKDNTSQQLLTYERININQYYKGYNSKAGIYSVPEQINNLLLSEAEKEQVFQNGEILTSLRDDIEGYTKQLWNSESINATVDAAKDAFFSFLRVLPENVGVVNLLKNQGVPFSRIIDFINHPTLQYYFTLRQNGMSRGEAIVKMATNRLGLGTEQEEKSVKQADYNWYKYLPANELVNKGLLKEGEKVVRIEQEGDTYKVVISKQVEPKDGTIISILKQIDNTGRIENKAYQYINKWINNNPITPERLTFLTQPGNDRQVVKQQSDKREENILLYSDELRIVGHFFNLEQANYAFGDFSRYFNFDTHKSATSIAVKMKENLLEKMKQQKLFPKEAIQRMEKDSILTAFINNDFIHNIYNQVFPILSGEIVEEYLTNLYEQYDVPWNRNKTDRDVRNLGPLIYDDFLSSILFSFGKIDNDNLFQRGKALLMQKGDNLTMVQRLINFKKQAFYKELSEQYPVLNRFISDKLLVGNPYDVNGLTEPFVLENIQLIKSPNESLLEQEEVIEQLYNLYYNYTYAGENAEKINPAIHNFVKELFITGMVQSGFSKSIFSYQEYIPFSFKRDIIREAVAAFHNLSEDQKDIYLQQFKQQFKNNNPKYFPTYKDTFGQLQTNTNNYSNRFKHYFIDLQEDATTKESDNISEGVTESSTETVQLSNGQEIHPHC